MHFHDDGLFIGEFGVSGVDAKGRRWAADYSKAGYAGNAFSPIIDDAHLMPTDCLRKLRLLCEDFPRSHNLVLLGQPPLLQPHWRKDYDQPIA